MFKEPVRISEVASYGTMSCTRGCLEAGKLYHIFLAPRINLCSSRNIGDDL